MIIKTFKAPTLKEAMANAKAELGEEAVLLHQKEVFWDKNHKHQCKEVLISINPLLSK